MAKVVSSFTMSLDGFIAGPGDDVGRLFKWYTSGDTPFPLPNANMVFKMSAVSLELFQDSFKTTGALVTGRG